jgi:hypothetical protein
MAYGLQVQTTEGLTDVSGLRAARLYRSLSISSSSGSSTISGFNSNDGFIFLRANDSAVVVSWSWNNASKVFSWSPINGTANPSSNMTAFFMVTT